MKYINPEVELGLGVYLNISGIVRTDDVDLRVLMWLRLMHYVNNVVCVVYSEDGIACVPVEIVNCHRIHWA